MTSQSVVYADDRIVVIEGEAARWLKRLGPYDHAITDPPYSARVTDGARSSSGTALAPWSLTERALRRHFSTLAGVVSRWTIATMDYRHAVALEEKPPEGARVLRLGVWVKRNSAPQFSGDRPAQGWEAVLCMHSDRSPPRWNGGGDRAVWDVPVVHGEHVNEKPRALLRRWVEQFTDPGDRIVDPFAGSGVLGEVALELGRRAVLIEKDPAHVNAILRRLAKTRQRLTQTALDFEGGG
jgi:site-specific DNA-methyltransferase (adenine-specific)